MPREATARIKGAKPAPFPATAGWYAIWTRSHFEGLVSDGLTAKGFESFLPRAPMRERRGGLVRSIEQPLFPGYLFVRHQLDKAAHVEILKTRGVVRVLGHPPEYATPVDDDQILAVRRLVESGLPVFPFSRLATGDRVRISGGPLAGVHGVFLRERADKGLLVVSVHLLQRSVAIEVDAADVEVAS
jgi:transcriptional antiterminator NusG